MATAPAQTAAQKNATMEGQYSFVQDLVSSVPELATLVQKASAQGASADAFQAMLEATTWWRTNASTARTMTALKSSDPATYTQTLNQASAHVKSLAAQMGITLTAQQLSSYSTMDLFQGFNDDQLKESLAGSYTSPASGSTPTGDVADYTQQLQALAASYGVPVTQAWLNGYIQPALRTSQSAQEMLASARSNLIQSASSLYPTLATQLQSGQTTTDIAQPYMAAMSQILELPETSIQLSDPTIQRALMNSSLSLTTPPSSSTGGTSGTMKAGQASTNPAPSGAAPKAPTSTGLTLTGQTSSAAGSASTPGAAAMPLWQFQDQLRADPRWQQTDNAKQTAYSMVASLGKQWGFAS